MDDRIVEAAMKEYFAGGVEAFLPHVSVNCVVLAYRHPKLQVLSIRVPGHDMSLVPGGFVKKTESLEEAAYRNLNLSWMEDVFLRQIRTFGDVKRMFDVDSPFQNSSPDAEKILSWARQRFITVVYYGLVQFHDNDSSQKQWLPWQDWIEIDATEQLAMDHAEIVAETRKILAGEIYTQPVLSNLLPETFTLNELRGLFEAILNRSIDRGSFRRKMLQLNLIEQVDQRKDSMGRPAHVYRFQQENYKRFLEEENKFGF